MIAICSWCRQKNRVTIQRLEAARCGSCKNALVQNAQLAKIVLVECDSCLQVNRLRVDKFSFAKCGRCGNKISSVNVPTAPPNGPEDKAGVVARNIKKAVSSTPVVSVLGDALKGFSGIKEIQSKLKKDPLNPLDWLFLYEAYGDYKKSNNVANIGRAGLNPIGFGVSKTAGFFLNAMDDQHPTHDKKKFLYMALTMGMNKVNRKTASAVDMLAMGRALYYLSANENNSSIRMKWLLRAIKYISAALQKEGRRSWRSEYFFYLAECYQLAGNRGLYFRILNVSRKLGFSPAAERIRKEISMLGATIEEQQLISIPHGVKEVKQFQFQYSPTLQTRLGNALDNLFDEQERKITNLGKKINKFLNT